jgi:hypothetical protein
MDEEIGSCSSFRRKSDEGERCKEREEESEKKQGRRRRRRRRTLLAMAQASYRKNCDGVCRGQRSPSQVLESEAPSYAAYTQGAKALASAESVLFGVCTLLATSAPLWTSPPRTLLSEAESSES